MLALWALFVLAAMVISWTLDINSQLNLSGNANRSLEAEAMACSGAEVALSPAVQPGSPLLRQRRGNASYETHITGEGGRLNLNWITAGENPQRLELLRKYLEIRGVDLNERDRMIDCLLDWIDPDNLVRLNGSEQDGDYRPRNAALQRLDEVKNIRGWEKFTAAADWDADFTVTSTGPIDLAWASRDVLMALPGMTAARVDQYLSVRRGPDGIDGTEDDAKFESLEGVQLALGLSADQFKALAGLVGFKDQVVRVVSFGRSGNVTRIVRMVIRKAGANAQLISWKEL